MLMPMTHTDQFNKSLEIQQSMSFAIFYRDRGSSFATVDLLASYNVNDQLTAIEEMIASGAEMQLVLRLLCLASITSGGIKTKSLDNLKREILQVSIFQTIRI
jgi:vacuolar protein sorting-associated protein 33A